MKRDLIVGMSQLDKFFDNNLWNCEYILLSHG